jgi:hypothetical protein
MVERKLSKKVDTRHGPVARPAQSPGLNLLYFFLGCGMQSRKYRRRMLDRRKQVVRYTVECNRFSGNIK